MWRKILADSYVNEDNEVRVIYKIVDVMDIESLGFNVGKNVGLKQSNFYYNWFIASKEDIM